MASAFKRKTQQTIGTSVVSIDSYTVPAATQTTVIGLVLANVTGSAVTVSVSLYDGVVDTYLVKDCPLPVGSSVVIVGGDQKVVMETGDSIRVQSDTASSVDAIMSILEIS